MEQISQKSSPRTCLFEGAVGTLGAAAVKRLSSEGINVVMLTHQPEQAAQLSRQCSGGPGRVVAVDNREPFAGTLQKIDDRFGSIDVFLSKTGERARPQRLADITAGQLDEQFHRYVSEVFARIAALVPYLRKSVCPRIILTAGEGASCGFPGDNAAQAIAQGGVLSMNAVLARQLLKYGITVNCIAASGLDKDHPDSRSEADAEAVLDLVPMKRKGTPGEFAALVSYLASEQSGYMTGQILHLSGGINIRR